MSQNPGVADVIEVGGTISTKTPLTASSPASANVTTSSAQIVAANSSRLGLSIINTGNNIVYLAFGSNAAVIGSGIALTTIGSVYEMSEYDYTTAAVNAISYPAGSSVAIQEWT